MLLDDRCVEAKVGDDRIHGQVDIRIYRVNVERRALHDVRGDFEALQMRSGAALRSRTVLVRVAEPECLNLNE